ncbi:helicase-associated domain-containing protein [Actinophytocola glycyrrhizae]|uniref:Helicase-associated domain-containing protein n=1 Tax=Actinophytocola glycyrrhizae TaxID=2044873 RepID=A0ABV9S2C3_9PSEU
MSDVSFARYLSALDKDALVRLLDARPDVRREPVPRGFRQLAQRLGGVESVGSALLILCRDTTVVGEAVAVLGEAATVPAVARLLGADEQVVRDEVAVLCGAGLAWTDGEIVHLPEVLRDHWTAEVGGGRSVVKLAGTALVDELRACLSALGVEADGLRKADLVARLGEVMADPRSLGDVIRGLPAAARARLEELRFGDFGIMFGFGVPRGRVDPTEMLVEAGLVLRANRRPEVPREVAVAACLVEHDIRLTGRPVIDTAAGLPPTAAAAAAREAVRAVSTLLDEAGRKPIAALKKGGVGTRERGRLAKQLGIPDDVLVLWIDVAFEAGLLGEVAGGYAPTGAYATWREAAPGAQWALLAIAWHETEHAPMMREIDGDRELPPPLPLMSMAGDMRRAMLREARAGLSVRGVGAEIDWFCPLHGYEPEARDEKIAATVREAELLGVVAGDRLTGLGEAVLAAIETGGDVAADAAGRCVPLLPEAECTVILQSDLTAVVTGQPAAAVSRLFAAAAVNEARGDAAIWRFTPASVRAALDAGWTAAELLAELAAVADRAVPQPLEYLVTDAARRHGQVRVRATRSCVVADEALATEILNTRELAKLRLSQVAPTVLTSPYELDHVLERLRAAGLSPVGEKADGTTVVERRGEHRAEEAGVVVTRPVVDAAELALRLFADPDGGDRGAPTSSTFDLIARLNPRLDDAELVLLSHAVDNQDDVLITYRDKNGGHTVRQIRPHQLHGRWLESFCYLRDADREFTVANIESVAPAR